MTNSLAKMIAGHSPTTPADAAAPLPRGTAPPPISTTTISTTAAAPTTRPKPNLFDDDPITSPVASAASHPTPDQPPTSGGCTFVAKKILASGRDAAEDAAEAGPALPARPAVPCRDCGSSLFWESVYSDDPNCCECLTPPIAAMVRRRWMLLVELDDDGRPRPGDKPGEYVGRWQECERDVWKPIAADAITGTDLADLEADDLASLPRDDQGHIDWWLVLTDDERRDLSTPTPESRRRRCPWCKRRASHAAWCVDMRREWGRMERGKHKGKLLEDVPEDYLTWCLQADGGGSGNRLGTVEERRGWLEELQGRERGREYRTPYWERLVEA